MPSQQQYGQMYSSGSAPSDNPYHLQRLATPGLDALAQGSQYSAQSVQQSSSASSGPKSAEGNLFSYRYHPYGNGQVVANASSPGVAGNDGREGTGTSTSGPVRRRISRACDQCNQLRTKCDGNTPCAHCVELGLSCEYKRERKKRGKASRKDLQHQREQQQHHPRQGSAAAEIEPTSAKSPKGPTSPGSSQGPSPQQEHNFENDPKSMEGVPPGTNMYAQTMERPASDLMGPGPSRTASAFGESGSKHHGLSIHGPNAIQNDNNSNNQSQRMHRPYDTMHPAVHDTRLPSFVNGVQSMGMEAPSLDGFQTYTGPGRNSIGSGLPMTDQMMLDSQGSLSMGDNLGYPHQSYTIPSPQSNRSHSDRPFHFGVETPRSGLTGASPRSQSPGWPSLKSPSGDFAHPQSNPRQIRNLRYPVLEPLAPHIHSILPLPLACDLLDLYFTSSPSAYMHPLSPYLLGFVFRKESILHRTAPRKCSPALLASMLWVAAQTSDASFLTSPPAARGRICQKLSQLTVRLLNPLVHGPLSREGSPRQSNSTGALTNGISLGGLGILSLGSGGEGQVNEEGYTLGANGALDDVATYIHLATVISASEYKAASLRWWNAAWSLARELKLNREISEDNVSSSDPVIAGQFQGNEGDAEGESVEPTDGREGQFGFDNGPNDYPVVIGDEFKARSREFVVKERKEERRRIWWLLFAMDRHLALCYNKPLALLDVECAGLFQPMDELSWQTGDFADPNHPSNFPRKGPPIECTDHSIFGYFLPLMTILGEIFDLHHARNRPRFEGGFHSLQECEEYTSEISQHLQAYERSLQEFESVNLANLNSDGISINSHELRIPPYSSTTGARVPMRFVQTKIAIAYGTHIMHVLHILLTGKWDPISLLDDDDLWISSPSFPVATRNAVSAAEAINDILKYDPDLSFMPFFFGMYLLQGSFLLLVVADKLQDKASPSVIKACETIVRAHEACVVTLSTEYQKNFRKVMLSAIAQVRGLLPDDFGEQQRRRRELLGLYRWTGDGTGLAL
ncbi:MAG: hypothetical protein M4579_003408 [Chaenotheca gracillima]|nr:MAG: hypothetical protein M4579_003408 [Chaenotheca gracillima]